MHQNSLNKKARKMRDSQVVRDVCFFSPAGQLWSRFIHLDHPEGLLGLLNDWSPVQYINLSNRLRSSNLSPHWSYIWDLSKSNKPMITNVFKGLWYLELFTHWWLDPHLSVDARWIPTDHNDHLRSTSRPMTKKTAAWSPRKGYKSANLCYQL